MQQSRFPSTSAKKPVDEVWVIGEGVVVGGRVGEENPVFIGKKKLEKTAAAESGSQTGSWTPGEPFQIGFVQSGSCSPPQLSSYGHLLHLVPSCPSCSFSAISQRDHLDLSTNRNLLSQQDCSSWIPLKIYGCLSAKYHLHDHGVV